MDAGKNWNDVTKNITGLPAWGIVSRIVARYPDATRALGLQQRIDAP
jgi:hypothetical protein